MPQVHVLKNFGKVTTQWLLFQMWNTLWPELMPCEESETVSVDEIIQLYNKGLNSETLTTNEVTD